MNIWLLSSQFWWFLVIIEDFLFSLFDVFQTGLLCGALKLLKVQRPRPDSILWLSLMHLASQYPYQFTQDSINQALCSLLRKDALKNKNSSSTILAANIFFEAYKETKRWPDSFVKVIVWSDLILICFCVLGTWLV